MRNCFQASFEGHSETSKYQAFLNPFDHCIKMKACLRVEGVGTLYPGVDCPPCLLTFFGDEIGEIVSSILLKGIQKLQMTRLFSIPLIST